jgi:D-alanyl-D-alanine carboxypeptidase
MSDQRLPPDLHPSVLTGGRRRRRTPVFLLAGAAVAGMVLGTLLYVLDSSGEGGRKPGDHNAATPGPAPRALTRNPHRPARAESAPGGGESRYAVDLSQPDAVRFRFAHQPRAGLMFDLRSGRVLWRLNPTRRLPIASLTKMMTALLIVEREGPHERVRIPRKAVKTGGSGVGVLPQGKKVQLEALLNGLLLVSGNDAAVALANYSAGSIRAFVRVMNKRAAELNLSCTHFTSPHGLVDEGNHSCAVDLATLARADMARGRIRRIAGRDRAILKFPIKGGRLFLYNNNPLMRFGYRGVTGLKTGYTERTGRSIVATARRGRLRLGVVLLHAYNPAPQAAKLLDRGFPALRSGF